MTLYLFTSLTGTGQVKKAKGQQGNEAKHFRAWGQRQWVTWKIKVITILKQQVVQGSHYGSNARIIRNFGQIIDLLAKESTGKPKGSFIAYSPANSSPPHLRVQCHFLASPKQTLHCKLLETETITIFCCSRSLPTVQQRVVLATFFLRNSRKKFCDLKRHDNSGTFYLYFLLCWNFFFYATEKF